MLPLRVQAQARYREVPFNTLIRKDGNSFIAEFEEPRIAAPGQSLVLYLPAQAGEGERCLGGGIINTR